MSILSNILFLLLSTYLICSMASGDKDNSSNIEIWGNLSETEILKYFKQYLAEKYQRAKNTTTSSPIQHKFGQKSKNETTSQTNTPELPSKSPIRARLEYLMGNPNLPPDVKSALKFLLEGNTTQSALSTTPTSVPQSTHYDESSGNDSVSEEPTRKETQEPQTRKETQEPQTRKETQEPQTRKETQEPQTRKETQEPQTRKETQEPQTRKETQEPQTRKETQEPQTRKETQEPQTRKETQEPQTRNETQEPQTRKETQEPQTRKETQEPQTREETQEPQTRNETQEPQTRKETQEPQTRKETQEPPAREKGTDDWDKGYNFKDPLEEDPDNQLNGQKEVRPMNDDQSQNNAGNVNGKVNGGTNRLDNPANEDDEPEPQSYSAWHFLTIFLVIAAVAVTSYVCVHNRKKVREGVSSYMSNKKRRRRVRDYQPLSTTEKM